MPHQLKTSSSATRPPLKHWQDRPYLYYLRESARILRLWMEREGLKHD